MTADMTDADKLRYIADWLDRVDICADTDVPELKEFGFGSPEEGDSVMQEDLRRIADSL